MAGSTGERSSDLRVAVVGAGVVGLATAYALKQRGIDCRVYETGVPGQQQSGGESRIFRHGHDDRRLVQLAKESRAIWRRWEAEFGRELIAPDGAVALGEGALERLKVIEDVGGLNVHMLDPDELAERLPVLAWYDGGAKFDPDGGAIRATAVIQALAATLGDAIVPDTVLSLRTTERGLIELRSGGERVEYDRVIVCAGRGTTTLARGLGLSLPIAISAHLRITYELLEGPAERAACLQDGSGAFGETGVYASPYPGNGAYAVGLAATIDALPDGGIVDPAALQTLTERTTDYVRRALPQLRPEPVEVRHCWVTAVPWSDDGIGVWSQGGAYLIAGHNMFKLAPVLGEALADCAELGEVRSELRPEARLGDA